MTYGEIVDAIQNLDPEEQASILLDLVMTASIAANSFSMHELCCRYPGKYTDTTYIKTDREAYEAMSKLALGTTRRLDRMFNSKAPRLMGSEAFSLGDTVKYGGSTGTLTGAPRNEGMLSGQGWEVTMQDGAVLYVETRELERAEA